MTNTAMAAQAYASAAGLGSKNDLGKTVKGGAGEDGGFGDMVNQVLNDANNAGQKMESVTASLATGQADVVDLVSAVAETELAVETLVTVRDRVISAYQEILSMPI